MALYRCSNGSFCLPCSAFQPNSTGKKSHQAWCRTTPVLIYSQPVKCCINPLIPSYMPWRRRSMAGGETRFCRCPVSIDGVFVLLTVQICQSTQPFLRVPIILICIGKIDGGLEPWKGQHGRQFSTLSENSKGYHLYFQYTWV